MSITLDGLPTDQKEVIVLGVFQDLSYAEIEDITGTKAVTLEIYRIGDRSLFSPNDDDRRLGVERDRVEPGPVDLRR